MGPHYLYMYLPDITLPHLAPHIPHPHLAPHITHPHLAPHITHPHLAPHITHPHLAPHITHPHLAPHITHPHLAPHITHPHLAPHITHPPIPQPHTHITHVNAYMGPGEYSHQPELLVKSSCFALRLPFAKGHTETVKCSSGDGPNDPPSSFLSSFSMFTTPDMEEGYVRVTVHLAIY